MNKTELIAAVAEKTGLSKKDSDAAVNAVLNTITETLNPRTKTPVQIAATKIPAFKAGKALKDAVAK